MSHHRLTHVPLNKENYNEEEKRILAIGIDNAFKDKVIEKIHQRQKKKIKRQQISTLSSTATIALVVAVVGLFSKIEISG
jgi:hypothetical protein